jgi:hypothetical protein
VTVDLRGSILTAKRSRGVNKLYLLVICSSTAVSAPGDSHHRYDNHRYGHSYHYSGPHDSYLLGGFLLGSLLSPPRSVTPRYARSPLVYVPSPVTLAAKATESAETVFSVTSIRLVLNC